MTDIPPGTTLQVIMVDELQPGDVVIVNLKERLQDPESFNHVHDTFKRLFGGRVKVLINDDQLKSIDIKRVPRDDGK